jgi:hypothetical protein
VSEEGFDVSSIRSCSSFKGFNEPHFLSTYTAVKKKFHGMISYKHQASAPILHRSGKVNSVTVKQ